MKKTLVVAIALLTSLSLVAAADASYYVSKRKAVSLTRQHLHYELGYHYTAAVCRPQGSNRAKPGYVYHRWVCGWVAGDDTQEPECAGSYLIVGHSDDNYSYNVLFKEGECPYG